MKTLLWHVPAIAMWICFVILMNDGEYTAALYAFVAGFFVYDAGNARADAINAMEQHTRDLKEHGDFLEKINRGQWKTVKEGIPEIGTKVEIVHFGFSDLDHHILDTGIVDEYGICPDNKNGGHGKRSTVTHWREIQ